MKKLAMLFALILMGFGLSGCGDSKAKKPQRITPDENIPAVLNTPISSQIAGGKVTATVSEDIYDSRLKTILIPKESKAIGYYRNYSKKKEKFLDILWTNIVTPQGVNLLLTKETIGDKKIGDFVKETTEENWKKYGYPLLLSTSFNKMQDSVSAVAKQYLQDHATIAPIILVKEGEEISIKPTLDILFPPSKNKEITLEFFNQSPSGEVQSKLIYDYVFDRESYRGDIESIVGTLARFQSSSDVSNEWVQNIKTKKLPKEAKIEITSVKLMFNPTVAYAEFEVIEPKKKTKTYEVRLKYAFKEQEKQWLNPYGFTVIDYHKEEIGQPKKGGKK